jgi:UDP-glucuronate 4-epimerase
MAYYSFTRDISEGRAIRLFNGGDMLRDFTFVSDAIEAVVRLLGRPPGGQETVDGTTAHRIFNIGNASPVRLADFVECLESEIGRKAVKELLPMQPGDVPVTYADTSRLRATVDYAPNTPIAIGLRRFVEWYRNYHCVADSGLSLPGEVSSPPAMMA